MVRLTPPCQYFILFYDVLLKVAKPRHGGSDSNHKSHIQQTLESRDMCYNLRSLGVWLLTPTLSTLVRLKLVTRTNARVLERSSYMVCRVLDAVCVSHHLVVAWRHYHLKLSICVFCWRYFVENTRQKLLMYVSKNRREEN